MDHIIAIRRNPEKEEGRLPDPGEWDGAPETCFSADWRGEHPDPERETRVRILWSSRYLYIRFFCRYRDLFVYDIGNSRKDRLWLRDVAEIFIQTGTDGARSYREFEISPNGNWLDLDIAPGQKRHLEWSLLTKAQIQAEHRCWTAELGIPLRLLDEAFNPDKEWRINVFRIEGPEPARFYSAWRPTLTAAPNFHIPERFGKLLFH